MIFERSVLTLYELFLKDLLEAFNKRFLRQLLCRNPDLGLDEGIVVAERRKGYQ